MTKKRKFSSYTPIKVEVKEENIMGDDYLMARGRLKGALKQLIDRSDSDSDSSEDSRHYQSRIRENRKRKLLSPTVPVRHTYVVKLFDRSVDLARFEEDTPLYPICRAWMANLPRNPQVIVKRRDSTPEPDSYWNGSTFPSDIYRLPPPSEPFQNRIPSPLPEQHVKDKNEPNFNYDEKPPVPRDVLIRDHLQRWVNIKKKWIETSQKNEDRYGPSVHVLQAINQKATEAMKHQEGNEN